MSINYCFISLIVFLSLIPPALQTCHDKCGNIPIKFPFGSGPGCGNPRFSRYIQCTSGQFHLSTASGVYTISSIDYTTNTVVITDPFMSTCSSMHNSGGFTMDGDTPFTATPDNIFVLVGCSTTSPVFDRMADFCDTGSGRNVCRGLYSCKGVSGIGLEPYGSVETCCVYNNPVGLGVGLDLPKLQCSSYSALYGFGGSEGDPMKWEYGIMVKYNGSDYMRSDACRNCEESGGFCGFSGFNDSFSCKCPNAVNTTVNCYGRGSSLSLSPPSLSYKLN